MGILFYHIVPRTPIGLGQGSMEFFFVLSGYLITHSILRRSGEDYEGLRQFAISRIRRLIPTLVLYLLFVGLVNRLNGYSLRLILFSIIYSVAGVYNYFQIFSSKTLSGLGGIWSLSVEDQYYYLIFLFISLIMYLNVPNKRVAFTKFYLLLGITSIAMRFFNFLHPSQAPAWFSYNTISRLWGFSCGGIMVLLPPGLVQRKFTGNIFTLAGAILLACYVLLISVRKYSAASFLLGWLCAPLLYSLALLLVTDAKFTVDMAQALVRWFTPRTDGKELFSFAWLEFPLRTLFFIISKIGVACYPIYLFQESDKLLHLKLHWLFSLLWALSIGFLVHIYWEKRFYNFPNYRVFSKR